MSRFFAYILFILIMLPAQVLALGVVTSIPNRFQILAEVKDPTGFEEGKQVIILSRDNQVVAFGRIRDLNLHTLPMMMKINVEEIINNSMVLTGDYITVLDFKYFAAEKIPGFNSLTIAGSKDIPSRYKELAYFGVFTSEGHTLDEGEILISPFQIQYGVNNDFGVKMVNALLLDGYINAGAKYRVLRNKHAKITINGLTAYKLQRQDWIAQIGGVITLPTNQKFQNHFMANFVIDPMFEDSKATRDFGLFQDSDIRSITEYITDDWNRVLYGPVYNVELQTFGGTVSYMWVWTSFHLSLGLATKDFTNLSFGTESGYYYVYDMFWRF